MSAAAPARGGLPDPPLLVITDRRLVRAPLGEVAVAAFAGGCRWLSVREKDLDADALAALAAPIVEAGHRHGARVSIHDNAGAARHAVAAGVHLPGGTVAAEIAAARGILGLSSLIGVSAHSPAEAAAAGEAGADYVTFGPVFESTGKPGYGPADGDDGIKGLAAAVRAAACPVIALGGVIAGNVAQCLAAGAAGIAVLGPVMQAEDPEAATAALVRALREAARPSP